MPARAVESKGQCGEPSIARRGSIPLHPFVLALVPVLGIFAHNANRMPLEGLVVPVAVAMAAVAAVFSIIRLLTGHSGKAGVLTTLVVVAVAITIYNSPSRAATATANGAVEKTINRRLLHT